ncbi:MAG: pilus assembly protein N-terminal domain-containing protein [Gammaproteobacteria bacterium]|nr:pilus assembly protein N-terminal domain-containing protein [Gammaproteobacteria bacterium]NVK86602.1 pilus assembly protein N-terminal domain-containing protein [Gammaproteobacteria bacterium]
MNIRKLALAVLLLSFAFNAYASIKTLRMHVGAVKTLSVGEVIRVAVGQEQILGTSILENGELLLIPKAPGNTDLHVWKRGERKLTYRVTVTAANMSTQLRTIKSVLSSFNNVSVRELNGLIILEGKIPPRKQDLYDQVIAAFPGIISLVEPEEVVIKDMIKFQVQVLEVNKNYTKQLGINWDKTIDGPAIAHVDNFNPNGVFVLGREGNPFEELYEDGILNATSSRGLTYTGIMTTMNSMINLLREDGVVRTLAEPSLSTRSGEVASFHSGGEYPIAILNEFGQPVVQMQDYGVILDIEPLSDENGNIVSKISAELSTIDFSTIVNDVPGILKRNTESVVNMKSGETIAISGLLQSSDSKAIERLPILGEIPILGELFTSRNFVENRSELIILVTPTIVKPNAEIPEKLLRHMESLRELQKTNPIEDELLE